MRSISALVQSGGSSLIFFSISNSGNSSMRCDLRLRASRLNVSALIHCGSFDCSASITEGLMSRTFCRSKIGRFQLLSQIRHL
ncbi:hypothetical protein D3C78_1388630 [compost metagenome]